MAHYLTAQEVVNRGYITDINIAEKLLQGNKTLDEVAVLKFIKQPAVYNTTTVGSQAIATEVINKETAALEQDDNINSNDITFTYDGKTIVYKGKPDTQIKKGLAALKITSDVYNGSTKINTSTAAMSTLAGATLTNTAVVVDNPEEGD